MNLFKSGINNKLNEHQNVYSFQNRRNARTSLYRYMKLFQIFGIDVRHLHHKQKKSTLVFTTNCLIRISMIMYIFILISETFIKFKFNENLKDLFVVSGLFLGSYLMWSHINKGETNFIETIQKLRKLEKFLEISAPEKTIKLCYLLFTTMCILSVCADAYGYNWITKWAVRNFTFGTINDNHWSIALFSFIIYEFLMQYGYFFVQYFGNFYVIVCRYMVLILTRHVELNECIIKRQFIISKNCEICFIRYDTILTLFDSVNSILGFPIFLGSCYNASSILLSALNIWKLRQDVSLTDIYFLISNFLMFTVTAFSASAVNEADKKAKKSNIRVLQSLSNKERCEVKERFVGLSQMCYSPAFALTGWDIFEFDKRFYFTAIGCFATYSLLILNL